ncbi:MAG: glycosyltransferase family 9 protein [Steroidobacteraceae bacterium]
MIRTQLTIQDARFGTRTRVDVLAHQPMTIWDDSRPVVILPMYGEFGWLIMTHARFVHSLAARDKVVCCAHGEACLFPSASEFFCDWENPIDDNDRCGYGGYRHGDRCGAYDAELIGRLSGLYPGYLLVRPLTYDCAWHLSDAVKFQPGARSLQPAVDVALGVRRRNFVHDKNWPHWQMLVRVLNAHGLSVGLVGSKASSVAELPARARAWDHADGDTAGTVDILRQCRLYVGGDSGTSHLAALMDVPMMVFRRELPGNPDWRGAMERSNKRYFKKMDDAAWFRPDEVIGSVFRCLTELDGYLDCASNRAGPVAHHQNLIAARNDFPAVLQ